MNNRLVFWLDRFPIRGLALCLFALPLAGCGLISLPMEALEESLQRDNKVASRHGMPLNQVSVGDSRASVYSAWGRPRPTLPEYPEFDLYLVVYSFDGVLSVLPGDFDEYTRTSLYVLRLSYIDGLVTEIKVLGSGKSASRRDWCDDDGECARMFIRHSVSNDSTINPLIIAATETGIDAEAAPPPDACEIVVFPSDIDPYWLNSTVYAELNYDDVPVAVMTTDTFLRFTRPPGVATLWANYESWGGGGALKASEEPGMDFQCAAGQRTYIEVGPKKPGFWAINKGVRVTRASEPAAFERLAGLREIRLPSDEPAAVASQ